MTVDESERTAVRPPPIRPRPVVPIKKKSGAGKWIGIIVMILVLGGLGYWGWTKWKSSATSTETTTGTGHGRGMGGPIPVVAAIARQGDLPLYVDELGTVMPFNQVTVNSRVAGQIVNIAFQEGQMVKQGDLLVEIDPRPYQVQLEEAQGQEAKDEAALADARADLIRYQTAGAGVTQQQIDTAQAAVREDEATVKSDQGAIDNAQLNLVYCKITAPITGKMGLRKVDIGNLVQANDPTGVATIAQIQPIALYFTVAQSDALPVLSKPNNGVGLHVDAWDPDLTKKLATGSVLAVNNQFDPSTGTVQIKASFDNKNNELYPDEFVNARLLVDTLKGAILVPSAAVQHGPNGDFLYVVKPDNTVEVRTATIGPTTGDITAISDGLKAGEVVVTDGVDKLQPGSKVAVREHNSSASTRPSTNPADTGGATSQPTGANPGSYGSGGGSGGGHGGHRRQPS